VDHLAENGRIVMLFSNLSQVNQTGAVHPIEAELANGLRFLKVQLTEKQVRPASKRTKRKHDHRSSESVQLWVLKTK
jgi:hypothetical protein